ncbi:MAG TPA: zinc ribbon domain-containing protein [Chloroflexota bacterium]|nr:zinc ribbon domain-containing protein [Chloroflexota bacterium]
MAEKTSLNCFACGEENTPDSRFCKYCGRPLLPAERRPSVAQNPQNRLLLILVLILLVACMAFGLLGLLSSRAPRPVSTSPASPALTWARPHPSL